MNYNPWQIGPKTIAHILATIPDGSTVLELGSGRGTRILSEHYTMHSIEHDPNWVGKYDSNYIYAPLADGWYCEKMLSGKLPAHYDLLLIDGPPGNMHPYSRAAMIPFLYKFNLDAHIIIDDVNRQFEMLLAKRISLECGRPFVVFDEDDGRQFAYIERKQ